MRAFGLFCVLIALLVGAATLGGLDVIDNRRLPIANSRAPTHFTDLPSPDPHEVSGLAVVPAAGASGAPAIVRVTSQVVNLRAGPGLDYRMITVAEQGEELQVIGARVGDWTPVHDQATDETAWVCGLQVAEVVIN